jgi:hypothetical protein
MWNFSLTMMYSTVGEFALECLFDGASHSSRLSLYSSFLPKSQGKISIAIRTPRMMKPNTMPTPRIAIRYERVSDPVSTAKDIILFVGQFKRVCSKQESERVMFYFGMRGQWRQILTGRRIVLVMSGLCLRVRIQAIDLCNFLCNFNFACLIPSVDKIV